VNRRLNQALWCHSQETSVHSACPGPVAGLSCRLVRGDYGRGPMEGAHAWNVVILYGQKWLCDVMNHPGELYDEDSKEAELYKRLPQRGGQGITLAHFSAQLCRFGLGAICVQFVAYWL